jgi:hypothetical protein
MGERAHAEAAKRLDPSPGRTLLEILVDAARRRRPGASA